MQSQETQGIELSKSGTGNPQWRQDIQGLRGVAVIVVVLFHAGLPIPGGFVGVDAFFVISGFVITGMLLREHSKFGKVSLFSFYLRRFKRLTPALIFMVSIVMVLAIALTSPLYVQSQTALTGLGATFLLANIAIQVTTGGYFDPAVELNPLLNTWSLSVEEQFYLVFPLLLVLGWLIGRKINNRMNFPVLLISIVAAVSLAATLLPKDIPGSPSWFIPLFGFYSPVVRTWEFAAGALLFYATKRLTHLNKNLSTLLAISGALLFFAPMWATPWDSYPGPWTIAPVTGTMLIILAGFNARNGLTRGLSSKPLVYVGDRSYAWYLWHWPVIVFAAIVFPLVPAILLIGAVVSIIPALLSFNYIENPIRLRKMSPKATITMLAASVVTATALGVVLFFGSSVSWNSSTVATAKEQIETSHLADAKGCHVFTPLDLPSYENCWFTDGAGLPIYMVGDSNAEQFSEALVGAGKDLDRPVSITTASACPFLIDFETNSRCATYIDTTVKWLSSQKPASVVIAMSSGYGQGGPDRVSKYKVSLQKTIAEVQKMGHEVSIVQAIPNIIHLSGFGTEWTAASCPLFQVIRESCGVSTTVQQAAVNQGEVWDATKLVAQESGSRLIQTAESLCPDQVCETFRNNAWSYRDSNHITSEQSARLAPVFSQMLSEFPIM